MNLEDLGWNPFFDQHFAAFRGHSMVPARVAQEHKDIYVVYTQNGELWAGLSGRMRHTAESRSDLPAVGDWVAIRPRPEEGRATIHAVLPRRSAFSRKEAGGHTEEQVAAANVDTAFLVTGLDRDFNLRRIERYLTLIWNRGVMPVIILNKADLCPDIETHIGQVESVAVEVPIHAVSAREHYGLDALDRYLVKGKTVALLGSSGVGKSTLINALIGTERQEVREVRAKDGRGRHVTTRRELILMPGRAMVIDSPGMRELQMWADEEGLKNIFGEVEQLILQCRFRDCQHRTEPGCAVKRAIANGTLDRKRFDNYLKLQRELRHLQRKRDQKARLLEKAKWKKRAMAQRNLNRRKYR